MGDIPGVPRLLIAYRTGVSNAMYGSSSEVISWPNVILMIMEVTKLGEGSGSTKGMKTDGKQTDARLGHSRPVHLEYQRASEAGLLLS